MMLCRLATIRLDRQPPSTMGRWTYAASNGVQVRIGDIDGVQSCYPPWAQPAPPGDRALIAWPYEHSRVRVFVSASVDAGPVPVFDGGLRVPEEPRRRAEIAIGEYADVLAVAHQCRRTLRSPRPCVALEPSTDSEREVVGGAHLRVSEVGVGTARVMPAVVPGELTTVLADRLDGLALLADALAEDTAIGRVRELFRFFERAFRSGPHECVRPLTAFLQSNPRQDALGFSEDELKHWFESLRPEAVHGDRRRTYARSPDAEPFFGRMEVAAYDVLFNKTEWRRPSTHRRSQQEFMGGLLPDGRTPVTFHPGSTLVVPWIDEWGVYPVDHEAKVALPPDWIWRVLR